MAFLRTHFWPEYPAQCEQTNETKKKKKPTNAMGCEEWTSFSLHLSKLVENKGQLKLRMCRNQSILISGILVGTIKTAHNHQTILN